MWAIEGRGPTGPVRTETEREGRGRQTKGRESSGGERWMLWWEELGKSRGDGVKALLGPL